MMHARALERLAYPRESPYRCELLQSDMLRYIRGSYDHALYRCSQWWSEYLHCIVRFSHVWFILFANNRINCRLNYVIP